MVRLLLSEGVDPNAAVEATGWHALLAAVEGGGKQLERRGDMHAAVRSPYLYNQLQWSRNGAPESLMHMANQVSTAQVLLEGSGPGSTKAKVNRVDKSGRSALWMAAAELCMHVQATPMIRLLLSHNAKSIPDFESKQTPLMLAESCGSGEATRLLQLAESEGIRKRWCGSKCASDTDAPALTI